MKNKILLGILCFLMAFGEVFAQSTWPLMPQSAQHRIVGTVGELRTGHFHNGLDVGPAVPGNREYVYATVAGTQTTYIDPANPFNDFIKIVDDNKVLTFYLHTQYKDDNGTVIHPSATVKVGDKIGIMADIDGPHTHLQLQTSNTANPNLITTLSPYADNAPPRVIAYSFYANPLLYSSTTSKYTTKKTVNNKDCIVLYNKADLMADVADRRTAANGIGEKDGATMPYMTGFAVFDNSNKRIGDSVKNIKFDRSAVPDRMELTFFSSASSGRHMLIITNNPFAAKGTSLDRYFNTGLRNDAVETWPANTTLDARYPGEAKYPDDIYRVSVFTRDIDHDVSYNMAAKDTNIIVDNFLPYIAGVDLLTDGTTTVFSQKWDWDGAALGFNKVQDDYIGINHDILVRATSSEPLKSLALTIPGITDAAITMTAVKDKNNMLWECRLGKEKFAAADKTGYQLNFTGADYADNGLAVKPSTISIRQADGTWMPAVAKGTDKNYTFKFCTRPVKLVASEITSTNFKLDWVSPGAKSWNWQLSGFCSPCYFPDVPYHPVYFVYLFKGGAGTVKGSANCGAAVSSFSDVVAVKLSASLQNDGSPSASQGQFTQALQKPGPYGVKKLNPGLLIRPNPVYPGGIVTVYGINRGDVVLLKDALGKVILKKICGSTGEELLVLPANLASGVYFIQAGKNEGFMTKSTLMVNSR